MQKQNLQLPDIEKVTELQHSKWVEYKRSKGFNTVVAGGEELLVPYQQLSETAKQMCRERSNMFYEAVQEAYQQENQNAQQEHAEANTNQ